MNKKEIRSVFRKSTWKFFLTFAVSISLVFGTDYAIISLLGGTFDDAVSSLPSVALNVLLLVGQMIGLMLANFMLFFGPFLLFARMGLNTSEPGDASWNVKVADVRGQKAAVEEMGKILRLIEKGKQFVLQGGTREKGVIMAGPPGTGKTMLAKAIASELKLPILVTSGASFAQMFLGMDALKVILMMRIARKKAKKWGGCVSPETLILTDDLRWVRADSLNPGDSILGVDEELKHDGKRRRLIPSVVEAAYTTTKPRYLVETDQGNIIVDDEHPFLAHSRLGERGNLTWRSIAVSGRKDRKPLQVGQRVKFIAPPWKSESGDSWLAGIIDGEGSLIYGKGHGRTISIDVAQNSGSILNRIKQELDERSIKNKTYQSTNKKCEYVVISQFEWALRLLGQVRPQRLLSKFQQILESGLVSQGNWATIQAIKPLGNGPIVVLQTSSRTYVAEGFVSHNCIIFIDEVDALGQKRSGMQGGGAGGIFGGGGMMGLNMLLTSMDGVDSPGWFKQILRKWVNNLAAAFFIPYSMRPLAIPKYNIFFLAATNRFEVLDEALIRPGRFGRRITFKNPDKASRLDILDLYMSKVAHDSNFDMPNVRDEIAAITTGYSPASIQQVLSMALMNAFEASRDIFTWEDLREAMATIEVGAAEPIDFHEEDALSVARHEVGHALALKLFVPSQMATRLSIKPRGDSLGHLMPADKREEFVRRKDKFEGLIKVALASTATERLFYGENTSGVSGDLTHATQNAALMASRWGMGDKLSKQETNAEKLGETLVQLLPENTSLMTILSDKNTRRATARILGKNFIEVSAAMLSNKNAIDRIAHKLVEKREVVGHEVEDLFATEKWV